MEASGLELTLRSCRGLKNFNFFKKLSLYAVVSIVSDDSIGGGDSQPGQRQKTPVDHVGNRNPEWNHRFSFDLRPYGRPDSSAAGGKFAEDVFVKFEVRCNSTVLKRTVGEVRVPLSDLVKEFNGPQRNLSYQVRTCDGQPNGVLDFSYKVLGKSTKMTVPTPRCPSSPEVVQATTPKNTISYPSIDINDLRPPPYPSPLPMLPRQMVSYDNVFYGPTNQQPPCSYKLYAHVMPPPGHVPEQYPAKIEVTGYGYYPWSHNQLRFGY